MSKLKLLKGKKCITLILTAAIIITIPIGVLASDFLIEYIPQVLKESSGDTFEDAVTVLGKETSGIV